MAQHSFLLDELIITQGMDGGGHRDLGHIQEFTSLLAE